MALPPPPCVLTMVSPLAMPIPQEILWDMYLEFPGYLLVSKIALLNKAHNAFVRGEMNLRWRRYALWYKNLLKSVDEAELLLRADSKSYWKKLVDESKICHKDLLLRMWEEYKFAVKRREVTYKESPEGPMRYINVFGLYSRRSQNEQNKQNVRHRYDKLRAEAERQWAALFFIPERTQWLVDIERLAIIRSNHENGSEYKETPAIKERVMQFSSERLRHFLHRLFYYRQQKCEKCKKRDACLNERENNGATDTTVIVAEIHVCDAIAMGEHLMRVGLRTDEQALDTFRRPPLDRMDLVYSLDAPNSKLPSTPPGPNVIQSIANSMNLITSRMIWIFEMGDDEFYDPALVRTLMKQIMRWTDCPVDDKGVRLDFLRSVLRMFTRAIEAWPEHVPDPVQRAKEIKWKEKDRIRPWSDIERTSTDTLTEFADNLDRIDKGTTQHSRALRVMAGLLATVPVLTPEEAAEMNSM